MASKADNAGLSLKHICNILGTVKYKWFVIGVQLGVPHHILKGLENEKNDPLAAVISYWLGGNVEDVEVCWKSLITALKSPYVEEHGLAAKINAKYCPQNSNTSAQEYEGASTHPDTESVAASKVSTNTSSGSSSQLSEVELKSHFPYLKNLSETEKLKNKMKLSEESKKIRAKFASLVNNFKMSLIKESTHKLEDIIGIIKYFVDDEELTKIEELLSSCKTIGEVFDKLREYNSFFNFDIIKFLISELGSRSIKKKLKKYKQKFRDYCKHRICECPKDAFGDEKEEAEHKYVLKTELKMTDTLEKLEKLQYSMNVVLGRKVLRLLHVDEGCVKLTFRVLVGLNSSLTEEQQQSLRDNGVLHISCGDQQYDLSHLDPTKTLGKPDNLSSADSAYISASATHTATLSSTVTTESSVINPTEELLESAEPTSVDSKADLHDIIIRGNIDQLKDAIKKKEYNPLSKDVYGYTALHTAAKYGKIEVMKHLIKEEEINPSIPGPQGTTPLNVAAEAGNFSIVKYLVEDQQDPSNDRDKDGYLPLHRACFTNRLSIVKYLFQKMKEVGYMGNKAILCEFTKHDTAPIHIAALHGHLDIVKFFIEECECDPNLSNKAGKTALFLACVNGSLAIVQYLVEVHHCPPSATDNSSNTPLHLAAQHGNLSIVQYLIEEKGYDPKCHNNQGSTPLLEASFAGMLNIVKYLIKIGCDPKNRDSNAGYNCLHAACCHGHTEVAQYLIKEQHMDPKIPVRKTKTNSVHIAATEGHEPTVHYLIDEMKLDPNCRDGNDYTPFHLAAIHDHLDVIKYLMEVKCDPLVTTSRNETPLSLAKNKGNHKVVEFIEAEWEILLKTTLNPVTMLYAVIMKHGRLEILREHKNEILHYISHNEFEVPLIHYAAMYGNLESMKYFIEEDIYKADCKNVYNSTSLHMAASSGQIEIFQYLVKECKCDPMCRASTQPTNLYGGDTYLGITPLHGAVRNGHLAMVRHILESDYEVDPEVQTTDGKTPLFAAAHLGHMDITKYLIDKHNCDINHRDKFLMTPLHAAAQGHLQVVNYLIKNRHCDPFAEDNYRQTPFHVAAIHGRLEIIDYYIKELKVDPNFGDADGITALHLAAGNGYMHVVEYLTKLPECNCSCTSNLRTTPLHCAAENGKLEIAKYLIKTAKCNHMDENIFKETPLHLAAECGHFEVTKFLVEEMHTPPALKNNNNQTPLHLALYNGHGKVALYLIVVLYILCVRPLHSNIACEY